jgi:hypothetical protein
MFLKKCARFICLQNNVYNGGTNVSAQVVNNVVFKYVSSGDKIWFWGQVS